MIRRINYWGASSYRKSTWAMKTVVALNELGMNAAYVDEEAKTRVLRGFKVPTAFSQIGIAGAQYERELVAIENYPIIVTDSPVHLASVYSRFYGGPSRIANLITEMATILDDEYPALNVLLQKPPTYEAGQRWQTESEADEVQFRIMEYLFLNKIPYLKAPSMHTIIEAIEKSREGS